MSREKADVLPVSPEPPEDEVHRPFAGFRGVLLQISFSLAASTLMWHAVSWVLGFPKYWLYLLFIPSAILFALGLLVYRNDRHWGKPKRRLIRLIEQIRAGDAPLEELSKIGGGLRPLGPVIQELFHDLKTQRANVAELNNELRQRIASRTHALERQVGLLKQQASRDGLTGLYNRRMFDSYLPPLIEQCNAESSDLSLLMIDVDHFKNLNDTLGHPAGDELLRNIGQIIRSGVRDNDLPFRLGGDEFVIILPSTELEAAQAMAKRFTLLVDQLVKPLRITPLPRLSIGVAAISQKPGMTAQQLIQSADTRLYEVKTSRRNGSSTPMLFPSPVAKSA